MARDTLAEAQKLLRKIEGGQSKLADGIDKIKHEQDEARKANEDLEKRVLDLQRRAASRRQPIGKNGKRERAPSGLSLANIVRGVVTGDWDGAEKELEAGREAARRVRADKGLQRILNVSTDSQGGYTVPEALDAEIIELLRAREVVMQLGARSLGPLNVSPFRINRQTGASTHNWVAEAAAGSDSTPTFDQLSLTPHKSMLIVKLTNEQIMLGEAGEEFVREDMSMQLALGEDLGFMRGTGASAAPLGLSNQAGIGTVAVNGVPDIDDLFNILYQLEVDNVPMTKLGWYFHPRTWNTLRQLKDGEGRYLLDFNSKTLLGIPYAISTAVPINLTGGSGGSADSIIALADWDQVIIANWGPFQVLASREASDASGNSAFMQDETWVRMVRHVDIGLRHPEAYAEGQGVAA